MIWTMEIPGWHPCALNKLVHSHHHRASSFKAKDREIVARACLVYAIPAAEARRSVEIHLVFAKGARACDPDAYWKSLLDALVHARALKNDSMDWVVCRPPAYSRGERQTSFITLQE